MLPLIFVGDACNCFIVDALDALELYEFIEAA